MIKAVQIALNNYLKVDFQNFTEKLITAIGFLKVACKDDKKVKEVQWFIDNTDENIMVNAFMLDRWVNPDGQKDTNVTLPMNKQYYNSVLYKRYEGKRTFESRNGHDYIVQKYLCDCINKVHSIVMTELKKYNIDWETDGDLIS